MNIELSLISKIIQDNSLVKVVDKQITSKYFSGKNKHYFRFIQQHQNKYGKPPSLQIFKRKFPNVSLEECSESIDYYCDELRTKHKHNILVNYFEKASDSINDLETEEAYDLLKKAVLKIENEVILTDSKAINKNTKKRMEDYLQRTKTGGITGIPTGIDKLDHLIKGANKGELITIMGFTGTGKAQPLYSKVLTPTGFTTIGKLKIGDFVINGAGKSVEVIGVFPQGKKSVYELTFENNLKVRCCEDHLWKYTTANIVNKKKKKEWKVETFKNIIENNKLKRGNTGGYNLIFPFSAEITFDRNKQLPIDPYLLGVLLGDGYLSGRTLDICTSEYDIIQKCNTLIPNDYEFIKQKGNNYNWGLTSHKWNVNELNDIIHNMGLKVNTEDKFIPEDYLFASITDRKKLLSGLFDTDGSISHNGTYSFSTINSKLKDQFIFLCNSLGYKCSVTEDKRENKYSTGVCYNIFIRTKDIIFTSKKHKERYEKNNKVGNRTYDNSIIYLRDFKYIGEEKCQCIMLDGEDHTYVTDNFIVTHNTFFEVIVGVNMAKAGNKVLFITTEMSTDAILRRVDSIWNRFSYTRFRDGQLTEKEFKKYKKYLDKMENNEDYGFFIEQATAGVSQISAKIDQLNPDVVIIDGGYMLEDDESDDDDWKALIRIWKAIHQLCLIKSIPIIISTQSNDPKVSLKTVSFAKAIMSYTDVALGLEVDEQQRRDRELTIVPLKIREAELGGKIVMNFDMDAPDWSTIYMKESKDFEQVDVNDVPEAIQKI